MASILFGGGLTPSIGILGGGKLGGEGVRTGDDEKEVLEGDDGENKGKVRGPECADASLCITVAVKGGVVKPSEA
jgi:hypothetical protein